MESLESLRMTKGRLYQLLAQKAQSINRDALKDLFRQALKPHIEQGEAKYISILFDGFGYRRPRTMAGVGF